MREVALTVGDTIFADTPIVFVEPQDLGGRFAGAAPPDPEDIRPDLAEVRRLHVLATDEGRPAATQKRHSQGKRTVRENIEDLCDPGTFIEYGPTVTGGCAQTAASRSRNGSSARPLTAWSSASAR